MKRENPASRTIRSATAGLKPSVPSPAPPGSESGWQIDGPGGRVAAIAVLPDGRPVELGTYQAMGVPRCYLHLRDKHGKSVEFVDVLPPGTQPETRWVRGTNQCRIALHRPLDGDTLVILAVEDNLVKGAAGQAVQNMNLMFGLPEAQGLDQIAVVP